MTINDDVVDIDFRRVLWRKIIVWVIVFFLVSWSVARFYWWN